MKVLNFINKYSNLRVAIYSDSITSIRTYAYNNKYQINIYYNSGTKSEVICITYLDELNRDKVYNSIVKFMSSNDNYLEIDYNDEVPKDR